MRNKVAEKLVAKALDWVGLADKSHTKLKIYRNMYDKNSPKTDFGIFLTNALPLRYGDIPWLGYSLKKQLQ